MELRGGTVPHIPKKLLAPIPAYDNWRECKTLDVRY